MEVVRKYYFRIVKYAGFGMEVMCMLREFIQCANRLERIHFLEKTKLEDWSSTELDQVMNVIGLGNLNHGLTDQQKFLTIYSNIIDRRVY